MTDDPLHFALQAALARQRVHLEQAVADNDAAIAAWDAIDDRRIDDEGLPATAAANLAAPASPIGTSLAAVCALGGVDDGSLRVCCSSHRDTLCAHHYARSHFVETMKEYAHEFRCDRHIDADEVEVTHFEDTELQFQNAATGERRSGSPISAKPGDAGAQRLAELVRDLADADDCCLDHHGYCQTHDWLTTDAECPHARARSFLAEVS